MRFSRRRFPSMSTRTVGGDLLIAVLFYACLVALLFACQPAHAAVPQAAMQYQRTLIRSAHAHWGLDAPVATMAGQVHQESRWNPNARSPVGAAGLAQFMPSTSEWFATVYPTQIGDNQPYNPGWALRAVVLYDRWLYARVKAADECQAFAMTLSAYNGGLGWVYRDQKLASASGADRAVWFGSVERYTARAGWAQRENRDYVQRIIHRWQGRYAAAGWGRAVCVEPSA